MRRQPVAKPGVRDRQPEPQDSRVRRSECPENTQRCDVCAHRAIYLDLGVNWCNTLQLYRDIPEARAQSAAPWEVWGFEAAPLIMPFAEKCAHALSSGLPIPTPPIPPAGSTKDLWRYAKSCDCERYKKAPKRDLGAMRNCMVGRLRGALDALRPDPTLTSNASLVAARLALARSAANRAPRSCRRPRRPPPASSRCRRRPRTSVRRRRARQGRAGYGEGRRRGRVDAPLVRRARLVDSEDGH